MARSKWGKGNYCVFTKRSKDKLKLVRCYRKESSAKKVAAAFNKNPRAKAKYVVREKIAVDEKTRAPGKQVEKVTITVEAET